METDREFKLIVESCVAENLDLAILVCFLQIIIFVCMYVCVPGACGDQNKASDPLKL